MKGRNAMTMVDAEEARRACSLALIRIANGRTAAAVEILEAFAQKCHRLVQGEKMETEQADLQADRFDLAALKVDLRSAAPERESD
jgi:hypothetical protein